MAAGTPPGTRQRGGSEVIAMSGDDEDVVSVVERKEEEWSVTVASKTISPVIVRFSIT